jgi:hypothetical protein
MIVVLKAGIEHRVLRFLGHALEFSGFNVSQTDVLHGMSPFVGSPRHKRACWTFTL